MDVDSAAGFECENLSDLDSFMINFGPYSILLVTKTTPVQVPRAIFLFYEIKITKKI